MKKLSVALFVTAFLGAGCPADDVDSVEDSETAGDTETVTAGQTDSAGDTDDELVKGVIDTGALSGGIDVALNGAQGTVVVPFSTPVPAVDDSQFQTEISSSVALVVASDTSGAAVDLMSGGTLVGGSPMSPGEFAWSLNASRNEATLTFFNETVGGLTLTAGNPYTVQFAIATNDYVERVSPISFPAVVQ